MSSSRREVAQERPDARRACGPPSRATGRAVQRAEKAADGVAIERRGAAESRAPDAGMRGGMSEKLRQIAFVGADGVRRHVAVEAQKLEENAAVESARRSGRSSADGRRAGRALAVHALEIGERALGRRPACAFQRASRGVGGRAAAP